MPTNKSPLLINLLKLLLDFGSVRLVSPKDFETISLVLTIDSLKRLNAQEKKFTKSPTSHGCNVIGLPLLVDRLDLACS